MGKKAKKKLSKRDALSEIMTINAMIAEKKIRLFEIKSQPNPDEITIKYLQMSIDYWTRIYSEMLS
jgi:hypothetical protein